MINNIHIQNFRGIKECTIDDMNRINLFLGYNNCGKTSVLDALFLFSGSTNPRLPLTVNWTRHYLSNDPESLILNFYRLNPLSSIHIQGIYGENTKRDVKITYNEQLSSILQSPKSNVDAGLNDKIYSLHLYTTIEHAGQPAKEYESAIFMPGQQSGKAQIKDVSRTYEEELKCIYLTASEPYHDNAKQYAAILTNKQEKFVINILKEIEPSLKDIVLADKELLADMGFKKRIPIQMLGDGIRKLLSLIISIYHCSNGILLVDEIDNGMHYKSMPAMWRAILKAAKEYNVQVFATTHNIDSLQTLSKVLESQENSAYKDELRVFTLRKVAGDELKNIKSTYTQFHHLINQEIELR